jgi:cephalosporin hydroxylase
MDINMKKVTGHIQYKGLTAQQHEDVFEIFKNFIKEIKPKRIIEIGTAGGGFTMFLRDFLNENNLNDTHIKTFDVCSQPWYDKLIENNIEVNIENIFDYSYLNLEKPEKIVPYIQQEGTTLVLCDGGHKIGEFNMIAPFLKKGDFIMAHDYVDTWENYKENYIDKIWNWCEIEEKYIKDVCEKYNLVSYNKVNFDKIVWVCKLKK